MTGQSGRYSSGAQTAEGWSVAHAVPPSRLHGSNGIRTGADGRIYVAQVAGSQISAIDVDSGTIETISPIDGHIVSPDDLAFDEHGNLFATEITVGRVGMLTPNGEYRVINGDMPVANPITYHNGMLIAGECRPDGRVMELDRNGSAHRMILEGVPMPNAFEVGPDGKLYMPIMGTNEIWRVDPAGGEPEVVAGDLGVPDSLKFDSKGRIVSTQVASGQVLRIDVQTGEREILAQLTPGLDNVAFIGERIFVSSIPGEIVEIMGDGSTRSIIGRGMQWPMGLAVGPDGALFVADGGFTYAVPPGGDLQLLGLLFTPGFPGFTRGVCATAPGEWAVTTSNAQVARWQPAEQTHQVVADGFEVLYGLAVTDGGTLIVADGAAGRLIAVGDSATKSLAEGLQLPMGVALGPDGKALVSEAAAGRVVRISDGRSDTIVDGLKEPQGIAVSGDDLFIVDVEDKTLLRHNLATGTTETIASALPVMAPPGVRPHKLGGVGNMSGPMVPFTGVAVGLDGTVFVSGDAEGSVLAIRPD